MTKLRGEAKWIFHTQQATQHILFGLRDAAVWRNSLAHLMQGIMTPAPGGPTRQNPCKQITLFTVAELLFPALWIGQADDATSVIVDPLPRLVIGCRQPG
ncbi:hypothetical protein [Escherichia coli]|uniref:hypothetical protein n=1 Tax=Escherichia coli TaxID=562 RepID=UPI003B3B3C5C